MQVQNLMKWIARARINIKMDPSRKQNFSSVWVLLPNIFFSLFVRMILSKYVFFFLCRYSRPSHYMKDSFILSIGDNFILCMTLLSYLHIGDPFIL